MSGKNLKISVANNLSFLFGFSSGVEVGVGNMVTFAGYVLFLFGCACQPSPLPPKPKIKYVDLCYFSRGREGLGFSFPPSEVRLQTARDGHHHQNPCWARSRKIWSRRSCGRASRKSELMSVGDP